MIDTVRFYQPRHFHDSAARRNWDITTIRKEMADSEGFEDEYIRSYHGIHKKMGIKFFGHRDQIITVEASLPRVLYGYNGKLLGSQADINAAWRKLQRTLDKISHPPEQSAIFKRVDLVWHVPGNCADFIVAHRHVRHPRVRKVTCTYEGESITWRGSALGLMLYDKTRKEHQQPGKFMRVEAQLRGHLLDEFFDDDGHILEFNKCYRYLRKLVLQLQPAKLPVVSTVGALLAACARLPSLENEVHPVEAYLQELGPRRRRDLRRQMEASTSATRAIDWRQLLPKVPPADPPQLDRALSLSAED